MEMWPNNFVLIQTMDLRCELLKIESKNWIINI
jgi:hypothetical protein